MDLPRGIVLFGLKGCGKSTIGRALAGILEVEFRDSDRLVEAEFAAKFRREAGFRDIYRELGEDEFRRLEARTLAGAGYVRGVLSLGGGAVSNPFVVPELLTGLGVGVWLKVPIAVSWARTVRGGLPPFLAGERDPEAAFCAQSGRRERDFAAAAELIFEPDPECSGAANAAALAGVLKQYFNSNFRG